MTHVTIDNAHNDHAVNNAREDQERVKSGLYAKTMPIAATPAKLFRPWRARRPLVTPCQPIQHAVYNRATIVAIDHNHRALPA